MNDITTEQLLEREPRTRRELCAWLRDTLDIHVSDAPLIEGHSAPMDYLAHAFLRSTRGSPADTAPPVHDCVVWANRGGGKTFYAAIATLLDLLYRPGIEVKILGGSLQQASRMHTHLRDLLARPHIAPLVKGKVTTTRAELTNGSHVELLAQSHTSVRGARPQVLRCDEVELFDPDVWRAAQLVTRSAQCGEHHVPGTVEALSTFHRPHGIMSSLVNDPRFRKVFRWGVIDTLEHCPPVRACERCALFDECAGRAKHIDPPGGHVTIDDAISLKQRSDRDSWHAEMLCERPSTRDLVYACFNKQHHVEEVDPPERATWVAGMDFGFRAPTVIIIGFVDGEGRLVIVDEHERREAVLDAHIEAINAWRWPAPLWIGVDPAGAQRNDQTGLSAIDVLKRAGMRIRARRRKLDEGLRLVHRRLDPAHGEPTLIIHPRCEQLIRAMESYHYPPDDGESRDPVKDGPDHACDALRYLVQNLDVEPLRTGNYA